MAELCQWDVRHRGRIVASGARPHRFDALHVCAAVVAGRHPGTVGKVTSPDGRVLYTLTGPNSSILWRAHRQVLVSFGSILTTASARF